MMQLQLENKKQLTILQDEKKQLTTEKKGMKIIMDEWEFGQ